MPSCFCGCITQILCNIFTINITFCQAGFTYVQSWATMYLYILLIGGIISIMKKQFLKGLLIKITSAVSATVLVFSAFAADTQAAAYNKVYSETDTTSTKAVWPDAPDVNSNSCILIDADTGSILFERNSHEKCYPASTTKILTGLLTIENCNMDDVVTFSQSAA